MNQYFRIPPEEMHLAVFNQDAKGEQDRREKDGLPIITYYHAVVLD